MRRGRGARYPGLGSCPPPHFGDVDTLALAACTPTPAKLANTSEKLFNIFKHTDFCDVGVGGGGGGHAAQGKLPKPRYLARQPFP